MSDIQARILDKLKKLLALSKSDNPHEAALALQRPQKLMGAYGISQSELELADFGEEISEFWRVGGQRLLAYMMGLLGIIRTAFGVESIIYSFGPKNPHHVLRATDTRRPGSLHIRGIGSPAYQGSSGLSLHSK